MYDSFIKIARHLGEQPILTEARLLENRRRGVCTALQIDTNLVIEIYDFMSDAPTTADRAKLQAHGLDQFVEICRFCDENCVPYTIVPGLCVPEIDPRLYDEVRHRYDAFFPLNDIHLFDDAEGKKRSPIRQLHDIVSLPPEDLKFRAMPFLYFCSMLIVDNDPLSPHPNEKFDIFLQLVHEYVGIFSEKELRIAMIVLGDLVDQHPGLFDDQGKTLIAQIVKNFARKKKNKKPGNADEIIRVAFNASSDIAMINAALLQDGKSFDGAILDVWFGSKDVKLLAFINELLCYRVLVPGEAGMFAEHSYPKGFEPALLLFEAKLFAKKIAVADDRHIAQIRSDLWVVRVREMLNLVKRMFQSNTVSPA